MDSNVRKTVAIAGAGDLAKYFVEELLVDGRYDVVVLSRAEREWFVRPGVALHITDYTRDSILSILTTTCASALFSFLHSNTSFYKTAHEAMLSACAASPLCKRFVPSEYGGDIDKFPLLPRFYAPTHAAFREVLKQQNEVEWTLVNNGWFMDYVMPKEKTYMKPLPGVLPINLETGEVTVLGTGDEEISWTSARDVAKALVRLIEADSWEQNTYVGGELGTWNEAIHKIESFYTAHPHPAVKTPFTKTYKPDSSIAASIIIHAKDTDPTEVNVAYMDEWNVSGVSAVPWDEVLRQREIYFKDVRWRGIEELMKDGMDGEKMGLMSPSLSSVKTVSPTFV